MRPPPKYCAKSADAPVDAITAFSPLTWVVATASLDSTPTGHAHGLRPVVFLENVCGTLPGAVRDGGRCRDVDAQPPREAQRPVAGDADGPPSATAAGR